MRDYLYALIRYVPDRERMEPINVGIVLQDELRTYVRLSPHAAKRSDVDTDVFRAWRTFLTSEIEPTFDPLFSPPRDKPEFLTHLARLCDVPILISRPLVASFDDAMNADAALELLLKRLVLPLEDSSTPEEKRPTGRFRELEIEYKLLKRGLKKHARLSLTSNVGWRPHRQVANGEYIAIDKIEVAREVGQTAEELNALGNFDSLLREFLASQIQGRSTRYILLADQLIEGFRNQSHEEFQTMKDDIERTVERVQELGGEVIRSPEKSAELANKLNEELPVAPF